MFENVQFFRKCILRLQKSAIMTQKKIFLKNINMGIEISNSLMPAFRNAPNKS
jgi:hypothetical protein